MIPDALAKIYDQLPKIECKGLCHGHCSKWIAAEGEFQHLTQLTGERPYQDQNGSCSLLKNKRCTVYEDRPYICRAYGVVEGIPCQFGCKPERTLTRSESMLLIHQIFTYFGSDRFGTN